MTSADPVTPPDRDPIGPPARVAMIDGVRRLWRLVLGHRLALAAAIVVILCAVAIVDRLPDGAPVRREGSPAPSRGTLPAVEPVRLQPIAPQDARAINATIPLAGSAGPAARPFRPLADLGAAARAEDCLAAAAFYEAGDEAEGERAVVQVVLNRVHHPAFPKTVCGVVFQGSERSTGCQFTFTCDGSIGRRSPSLVAWTRARAIATAALSGTIYAPVGLATHYHADWVVPYWSASLDKVAQIGPHIFYRWAGWWGTPNAFRGRDTGAEPAVGLLAGLSDAHRGAVQTVSADGTLLVRGPVRPMLSAASDPDLFLVRLPGGGAGDGYRLQAERLCAERDRCTVYGWVDPGLVARSLPLSPEQMDGLTFRYTREDGTRPATMRWDCARGSRRDPAECLRPGVLSAGLGGTARQASLVDAGDRSAAVETGR